ncbi:MAG: class I SAM-dependent methyltransferase [Woeseiaceae bacterium]|jgi:SAM-dependent methyltransferase
MTVSRKDHWDHVYENTDPNLHSWYQDAPAVSMKMIRETGVPTEAPIIDVGGGVSTLVDILVNSDYSDITVLDISNTAIAQSRMRLGDAASRVRWIQADILEWAPKGRYYLWHDRAVFHFMNDDTKVNTYLETMRTALVPKGYFVLATFGPEGPDRCSGLDVRRYSIESLTHLLEGDFELKSFEIQDHTTPTGTQQQFLYSSWQMTGGW